MNSDGVLVNSHRGLAVECISEIETLEGLWEGTWHLPDPASWELKEVEPRVDHISARIGDLVVRLPK
jgi:hypothetical protein